jgi:hypothetical protein
VDNPIYDEVKQKIVAEIPVPESEIQVTLRLARERYKQELAASRDFHKQMATEFENSGENQLALRQRVLAEIYQSSIDRA